MGILGRMAVSVLTLTIVGLPGAGHGHHALGHATEITFSAQPCAAACAMGGVFYSDFCGSPLLEGSYDDVVVVVPPEADWLVFESFPEVDWDTVICSSDNRVVAWGINILGRECKDREQGDRPFVGCAEVAEVAVRPGERYVLRAFNFSDPHDLFARYTFHQTIPSTPPPDETDPPTIGGLTSVSSDGNGMVTLLSPARSPFDYRHMDLRLTGGSFAFVAIIERECGRADDFTCVALAGFLIPDWDPIPFFLQGVTNDGHLAEGEFDVYVLTDGEATFDLSVRDLTGRQGVTASQHLDGEMGRLPERCEPLTDCRFVSGGDTRTMRRPGFVVAIGYATIPSRTSLGTSNRGTVSAEACVERPRDREAGCEMLPHSSNGQAIGRTARFAANAATTSKGFLLLSWTQVPPEGEAYAGFAAAHVSAQSGGKARGYGIWLRVGG